MARLIAALLVLAALASCTSQKIPDKSNLTLGSLSSWQLRGKIGVRSGQGNFNLGFAWNQSPASYDITLSATLGTLVAQLNGNEKSVLLTLPDGSKYQGKRIDELLETRLGYHLPFSLLQYWVRGVPDPGIEYEPATNGFSQSGWLVEFRQFGSRGPRKIEIQKTEVGCANQKQE